MRADRPRPPAATGETPEAGCRPAHRTTGRGPSKIARVLERLAAGERMTRYDAERIGDHCLPSTVARIESYGVRVAREYIAIDGRYGRIRCARYWIDDLYRATARVLAAARR